MNAKRCTSLDMVQEALSRVGYGLHPRVAITLAACYLQADREVTDEQVADAEDEVVRSRKYDLRKMRTA